MRLTKTPPRCFNALAVSWSDERREVFIDILRRTSRRERIVTTVELLSLSNKSPGDHGRTPYLRKQQEVLDSDISLVEIDLLRAGRHSSAVPKSLVRRRSGAFDYHVCIAPANDRNTRFVYTIRLADPLPVITIPLFSKDTVALDLQAVMTRCYHAGPYRRQLDYELDQIVPTLTARQAKWAAGILRRPRK